MRKSLSRGALLVIALLCLPPVVLLSQQEKAKAPDAAKTEPPAEASLLGTGTRYVSGNRRDPFLNPLLIMKKSVSPEAEAPRGQPPPGIAGMFLAQVKLLGVVSNERTTAVFEGTDKRAYFLQEKDKFFDGYVRTIEADSVILIRETKLMSGRVVTQEVIKRLRTP